MATGLDAAVTEPAAQANRFLAPFVDAYRKFGDWLTDEADNLLFFAVGVGLTLLCTILVSQVLMRLAGKALERFHSQFLGSLFHNLRRPVGVLIFASGLMVSLQALSLPAFFGTWLPRLYFIVVTLIFVWFLLKLIHALDDHFMARAAASHAQMNRLLIDLIRRATKGLIWLFAILFIAQNIFHLNVSAILAGAGVAGLAIALAAQNTLGNIFSAIALIVDKPFSIGDRIQISNEISGTVEAMGLRSTKLRALDGVAHFIPNRQLADSIIENFALRPNLKQVFDIGLTYDTPPAQMQQAVAILHEILDHHPLFDMRNQPPLIFFSEFRDWSLNINVIVWFQTTDFPAMQAAKQEINLAILNRFNAAGLNFAFPSQTNYLVGPEPAAATFKS